MLEILPVAVALIGLMFWAWMLWEFAHSEAVPPSQRFIWIVGFILFSVPVALYYYLTIYREQN
ncbi:hypothetical protein HJC99_01760 [Candidatus Saccharibacteria bacterium]|nr:hypothetical protein [Candidatus Saccharibacteria bacterium]